MDIHFPARGALNFMDPHNAVSCGNTELSRKAFDHRSGHRLVGFPDRRGPKDVETFFSMERKCTGPRGHTPDEGIQLNR